MARGAAPAWGTDYVEFAEDGTPIRKPDGVHVCPLGSMLFADFFVHWLQQNISGFEATDPSTWPLDFWSDERYYRQPAVCRTE